jgi:hypothetical protein
MKQSQGNDETKINDEMNETKLNDEIEQHDEAEQNAWTTLPESVADVVAGKGMRGGD